MRATAVDAGRAERSPRGMVVVAMLLLFSATAGLAQGRKPVTLPPLKVEATQDTELLTNADFEKPDTGWRLYDWPPREKTADQLIAKSIFYAHDVVHSGQGALCFDHSTVGPERLLAISQGLTREALAPYDGRPMKLSGWIWIARGPRYYQGNLGMRQWGEPGAPPFGGANVAIGGPQGEWCQCSKEFTFTLGDTKRADVNVWLGNIPDVAQAPLIYLDDVSLQVLTEPPLAAGLVCGRVVFQPDNRVPFVVTVSPAAWQEGMRSLQWDVTSADGLRGYASGRLELAAPKAVGEAVLPNLAEGEFGLRLALGTAAGQRTHEVLLPFRRAEGPFAH